MQWNDNIRMIYRLIGNISLSQDEEIQSILDSSSLMRYKCIRRTLIIYTLGIWLLVFCLPFSMFLASHILDAMNGIRITSTYFVCKIGSVSCIKKRMFIPLNNLYFDHFSVRSNPLCFTCRFSQKNLSEILLARKIFW